MNYYVGSSDDGQQVRRPAPMGLWKALPAKPGFKNTCVPAGLNIQSGVLMTNHLHTICSCKESRKEYLLHTFATEGKKSSSNFKHKFWEHENHPVLLENTEMYNQRLNYLHWNPVTAGFVAEPWHWIYSSAIDYYTEKKGLPDLIILDGF